MAIVAAFPSRYVQGISVLEDAGTYLAGFGKSGFVIGGKTALSATREKLNSSLGDKGIGADYYEFYGECSDNQINAILKNMRQKEYQMIIGVGGGRALDTAKAVAFMAKLPLIIIPTVAASDAPCSSSAAIYDDEGNFVRTLLTGRHPDLILVDTGVIIESPLRLFVSGIGDAICTWYEAEACRKAGVNNRFGGMASYSALGLAKMCHDIILEYGLEAYMDMKAKSVTPAFERVLEAIIFMSCIGFENGGLSLAHAFPSGFSVIEKMKSFYHGEKVGFFTLVQLLVEGKKPDEIASLRSFYQQIGLPDSLKSFGIDDLPEEELLAAIRNTFDKVPIVYNIKPPATEKDILHALQLLKH